MKPSHLFKQATLVLACIVALLPSVFMILTALKSQEEYTFNKVGLPGVPVGEHFRAIARMEFRGRDTIFAISTSLMAVPPVVMIVPLFVLYTQLGLISTFSGAIVIYAGLITPFSVYLLTTFFRTLPQELFDAAVIDGCNHNQILRHVVLPLSVPALLTLVVVNALFVWNDLLIAVIFLQEDGKRTLMAGISVFQGRYNNQIPLSMAGMVVASAPMVILYITFQRYFIRGLMAGAIK